MHIQFDTSTRIRDAAVKVASGFLARKEGLTDGVVKIANDQGLNATQARRVCERANHLVHAALRKQANVVEFELADPTEAARRLGDREKVATRYFIPNVMPLGEVLKIASEKAAEDEDEDTQTVKRREAEHEASRAKTAAAAEATALNEAAFLADEAHQNAQEGFYAQMMKVAADGDLADTMECLAEYAPLATQPHCMLTIAQIVKLAHVAFTGKTLSFTPRTLEILHSKEELEKVASEVDPDLTNPGLQISGRPVKFIRGRHAIWMSVDTLLNSYMSALMAHDAVARPQLSPDNTRAEFCRNGVTHKATREYSVVGRGV
jgi:hypothetical protein